MNAPSAPVCDVPSSSGPKQRARTTFQLWMIDEKKTRDSIFFTGICIAESEISGHCTEAKQLYEDLAVVEKLQTAVDRKAKRLAFCDNPKRLALCGMPKRRDDAVPVPPAPLALPPQQSGLNILETRALVPINFECKRCDRKHCDSSLPQADIAQLSCLGSASMLVCGASAFAETMQSRFPLNLCHWTEHRKQTKLKEQHIDFDKLVSKLCSDKGAVPYFVKYETLCSMYLCRNREDPALVKFNERLEKAIAAIVSNVVCEENVPYQLIAFANVMLAFTLTNSGDEDLTDLSKGQTRVMFVGELVSSSGRSGKDPQT